MSFKCRLLAFLWLLRIIITSRALVGLSFMLSVFICFFFSLFRNTRWIIQIAFNNLFNCLAFGNEPFFVHYLSLCFWVISKSKEHQFGAISLDCRRGWFVCSSFVVSLYRHFISRTDRLEIAASFLIGSLHWILNPLNFNSIVTHFECIVIHSALKKKKQEIRKKTRFGLLKINSVQTKFSANDDGKRTFSSLK